MSRTLVLGLTLTGLIGVPACLQMRNACVQAAGHQYSWSEWTRLNDGKSNGIKISFRKGDNNFIERGMVFAKVFNQYDTAKAEGTIEFTLVNSDTGEESPARTIYFDLDPGEVKEDPGSWYLVPGKNSDPDEWSRRRIRYTAIRLIKFKLK